MRTPSSGSVSSAYRTTIAFDSIQTTGRRAAFAMLLLGGERASVTGAML